MNNRVIVKPDNELFQDEKNSWSKYVIGFNNNAIVLTNTDLREMFALASNNRKPREAKANLAS